MGCNLSFAQLINFKLNKFRVLLTFRLLEKSRNGLRSDTLCYHDELPQNAILKCRKICRTRLNTHELVLSDLYVLNFHQSMSIILQSRTRITYTMNQVATHHVVCTVEAYIQLA